MCEDFDSFDILTHIKEKNLHDKRRFNDGHSKTTNMFLHMNKKILKK